MGAPGDVITDKMHLFLKLDPPGPSFTADLSDPERKIMQEQASYWSRYIDDVIIIVLGPVFDPKGSYGIGVAEVDSKEQLDKLKENDPGNKISLQLFYCTRE